MWERRLNDRSTSAEELDQKLRTRSWAFPEIFWPGSCQGIPGKVSGNFRESFREFQGIPWNRFPEFGSTGKVQGKYREFQGKFRES